MKRVYAIIFLAALVPAMAEAGHSNCTDYCNGLPDCHDSIEQEHNYLGACANYGYSLYGVVYKGKTCDVTTGTRNYTVNSMNCTESGVCYGSGVLNCGFNNNHQINVTCVPPEGGTAKFEMTRQHVSCTRSDASGFNISCGGGGLLTEIW